MPEQEESVREWIDDLKVILDLDVDLPEFDDPAAVLVQESTGPLPKPAGIVALQKSRLLWLQARENVRRQLESLANSIVKERPEEAAAMKRLDDILTVFDLQLIDVLDLALNAEGAVRAAQQRHASKLVARYQAELERHQLVRLVDQNPWTPLTVAKTLATALRQLGANLE